MRAVLLFLTGRSAGNRRPVATGVLPISDAADTAPTKVQLHNAAGGWVVSAVDPTVSLRVNGRLVRERLLQNGDFIGCGRSLYRLDFVEEKPADLAPRRTIALQDVPSFAPRQKGLSTVVTAPGRWGNVFARWYGGVVLHLYGPADPHPDHLVARLGQRVRCHVLVPAGTASHSRESDAVQLSESLWLVALNDSENTDAAFIDRLWDSGAFFGVSSPLEPQQLADKLRPLSPLLAYPAAIRSFLAQAESSLVDGLRSADAGLLLSRSDGWELYCCPAMLPLARRLGFPDHTDPARPLGFEDCSDGLTRISGDVSTVPPSEIAALLSQRDSLYLIIDAEAAREAADTLPLGLIDTGARANRYLLGPAAGSTRFELIDRHWGRGTILGVCSGREERSVVRLVNRFPERADLDLELPSNPQRDRLGGFDAILYDPGNATWAVFADPQPKPVWQRYGLPAPMLGKAV